MQHKREDRVKVQLSVHRPISGYTGVPGDYYVAVTGSGLQLGNNDPDKAPRCQPIGHDLWVKDIWPVKNSDIKFKFLVIRRGSNTIVDIEHIATHNVSVENKPIIVDATYNRPRISAIAVEERPGCAPKYCRKIDREPVRNKVYMKHRDQSKHPLSTYTKKVVPMQMAHARNTPNAHAIPQLQNRYRNTGEIKNEVVPKEVTQKDDNIKLMLEDKKMQKKICQADDDCKLAQALPQLQKEYSDTAEIKKEDVPKEVTKADDNTKILLEEKEMLKKICQTDDESKVLMSPPALTTTIPADDHSLKASVMPKDNRFISEPGHSHAENEELEALVQEEVAAQAQTQLQKEYSNTAENTKEDVPKEVTTADDNIKILLEEKEMLKKICQTDDESKVLMSPPALTTTIPADYHSLKASISEPEGSKAENEELESLVQEDVAEIKGHSEIFTDETEVIQSTNTRCYPWPGRKVVLGVAGVAALIGLGYYAFFRK